MNIAFGISPLKKSQLQSYIKAGVDEFFTGYISREWINTFGWEVSINRRQWPGASFTAPGELEEVVRIIHKNGKKIFLTINEHDYSEKELDLLLKIIRELRPIPLDAFIVSSLPLMIKLRNKGVKTPFHISIGGGCNNFEVMRFYKKNIENITRYILPRKLTIEEITRIAKEAKPEGVELEIFGIAHLLLPSENSLDQAPADFGWSNPGQALSQPVIVPGQSRRIARHDRLARIDRLDGR